MHLKCHRRLKDGKEHRYWSIVESRRCAGGRVVQRHVLYLGEINDSQKASLCPSAKVTGSDRALNYSANPNVCKDYNFSLLVRADTVPRPSETILSADGIQYKDSGDSHAIFWGLKNGLGRDISYNDGDPARRNEPLPHGADVDSVLTDNDPAGANLRYRHVTARLSVLYVAGNVEGIVRGRLTEGHVYSNY